jgi:hypothetical protein
MCRVDCCDYESECLTAPHQVTARKEHKCINCGGTIAKGESYETRTWVSDGSMFIVKYCARCVIAGRWLNDVCGGYLWGDWQILEDLQEHWDEEPQFRCRSLALLIAAMRRGWKGTTPRKVEGLTRYATAHALREIKRAQERQKALVPS